MSLIRSGYAVSRCWGLLGMLFSALLALGDPPRGSSRSRTGRRTPLNAIIGAPLHLSRTDGRANTRLCRETDWRAIFPPRGAGSTLKQVGGEESTRVVSVAPAQIVERKRGAF
jgi:hypothetical protein